MPIANHTDFARAGRILSEMTGGRVSVQDSPYSGTRGVIDAQDRFVRTGANGRQEVGGLGERRFNEITFRMNVIRAAKDLAASGAQFSGDQKSDKVNKTLWTLGYGGRMQVRKFVDDRGNLGSPAKAIRDIFQNGRQYGFECATAMMVIFHKAILDTIGDAAFDAFFTEPRYLTFFRWSEKDDDYLALERVEQKDDKLVAGSHYYYKNPDASDANSAFSGENVIYLGERNGERLFYAHGVIGRDGNYLVTEGELLRSLSSLRRPGATQQPFRADFSYSLNAHKLAEMARTTVRAGAA